MDQQYKLSICIPTFNRGEYIKSTIDSIVNQCCDNIEIVISDNASTDNTEIIVKKYIEKFSNIKYIRQKVNLGADLNYLEVVKYANGNYCWFLGSDDQLVDGSLAIVLKVIAQHNDIYICSRINCNYLLTPIKTECFVNHRGKLHYNLSNSKELIDYLNKSNSLAAIFSYLSSIIFIKSKWDNTIFDNTFNGSAYAHVFMLFSFIEQGANLKYINSALVYNRGGNDSFLTNKKLDRFLLDIDGYTRLTNYFFKDNERKTELYKFLCRITKWKSLYYARIYSTKAEWKIVENKLIAIGYNKLMLNISRNTKFVGYIGRFIFRSINKFENN
jgi:abequosyltransferase